MVRPLLALLFLLVPALAWAQQQNPPPDTKPARERHRIAENEPPPPEGPWGGDLFGITWFTPKWRGLSLDCEYVSGDGMALNVPHGEAGFTDGVSVTTFQRLNWNNEAFRTLGPSATIDMDMIRLSLYGFSGSFDARATLTVNDGVNPQHESDVVLHGLAEGLTFGVYWPTFRYRDTMIDASLGLFGSIGWLHEQVQTVPDTLFPMSDAKDVLTGSLGPKVSFRYLWDRVSFEVGAGYTYQAGGVRGWTSSLSAGVGIAF